MDFDYSVDSSWYEGVYQDKKAPVKAGRPFSLIHKDYKSSKAVLCLHGYTGYPGELVRPARELFDIGYDVYVPRLPGHGTSGADFYASSAKDWVAVCLNAARDLDGRYETLCVVGHSMGGALATIVAAEVPSVKKLVLAAPALALYAKQLPARPGLLHFVSFFMHRIKHKWAPNPQYVMYYEDAPSSDMELGAEYWSWLYPKQLYSLFNLMLFAGGNEIKKIKCPTLVICVEKDQVLGTATCDLAMDRLCSEKKLIRLENGTHYLYYDIDKKDEEKAVNATIDFLR